MPPRLLPHSVRALLALTCLGWGGGCIGNRIIHPEVPSPEELAEFHAAGPEIPTYDADQLMAVNTGGPYKLVSGDLILLSLPPQVFPDYESESGDVPRELKTRIDEEGKLRLPKLGLFPVAGLTLAETEISIATAYTAVELFKKERPNVVCTVEEYRTVPVTVWGAVGNPGIYPLRSDRLSVLGALMAAGGINTDRGSSSIRIQRPGADGKAETVPVHSTDIPLYDIALMGGETIVVDPAQDRKFSVTGLVKKVGLFPYPEHEQYNLMQAIAVAGGVDATAAPRFATIYRKKKDGEVIGATFRLDGLALVHASNILVKGGDVIAVEHTEGSWFRSFLSDVFGFRLSGSTTTTL